MLLSDDYVEVVAVVALSCVNALLLCKSLLLLSLSLLSSMSLKLYVVVEYVVESMHTHIKLGAYALLNV